MKPLTTFVLVFAVTFAAPAIAGGPTQESTLLNGATLLKNVREYYEPVMCKKQRAATPQKCQADCEVYVDVLLEYVAREILYLRAVKANDAKNAVRLKNEVQPVKDRLDAVAKQLDETYLPKNAGTISR